MLALTGIGAVLAVVFWAGFCWRGPSPAKSWIKTGSVAVLALAAAGQGLPWLAAALGFGAFGDYCLSRNGEKWFLAGMGGFGVAHVLYGIVMLGGAALPGRWWAMIPFGLFGLVMAALLWRRAGELRVPILIYLCIIMGMAFVALALGTQAFWPLVLVAALLFVTSDSLLATELFLLPRVHPAHRALPFLVWPTYWLAQAGFLWGIALSLN